MELRNSVIENEILLREKSRIASRNRRDKQNAEFVELTKLLPLPSHVSRALSKVFVIKLTTSYIKLKDALYDDYRFRADFFDGEELKFNFMDSFDGFFVVLDYDGKIIYISETLKDHLGLSQLDLIGSYVYDYVHPSDHEELITTLSQYLHTKTPYSKEKSLFLRMRCILGKKNAGLTQGLFKVVHLTGRLRMNINGKPTFFAVGKSLPSSPSTKVRLDSKSFVFRTRLDLRFTYIDEIMNLLGYKPKELIDKNLYDYIHANDMSSFRYTHQQLITKGQATTQYYRFLCKFGGYVWLQSELTVVYKHKGKPNCVVAVTDMLSNIEEENLILSHHQINVTNENFTPTQHEIMLPTTLETEENFNQISCNSRDSEVHFVFDSVQNAFIEEYFEENVYYNM